MKAPTKKKTPGVWLTAHRPDPAPGNCFHSWTPTARKAAEAIPAGSENRSVHLAGMRAAEPVTLMLDTLHRYAVAHEERFERTISEDYVLGPLWLNAVKSVRGLLDGVGQFDGGACETMFWAATKAAGFTQKEVEAGL